MERIQLMKDKYKREEGGERENECVREGLKEEKMII